MDENTNNSTGSVIQPTATDESSNGTKIDVSVSPSLPKPDVAEPTLAADVEQPSLAPEPPVDTPVAPAPEPISPISAPPESPLSQASVQPPPEASAAQTPETPPAKPAKAKGGSKKMLVILVVIVAIVLISGAAYMFLKKKKDTTTTGAATTTPTVAKVEKATSTDVTQTSSDLDTNLQKIDDTKDFASTDLTDTALGIQ